MPEYLTALDHGIYVIDTGFYRPQFDACYLIVENGRAAFVDAGVNHSLPRLLGALHRLGLPPEAVDWVIATHVHLDHAGGVGLLMQQLPNATLVVHKLGAPHLIDPERLVTSARAVYGAIEFERAYGAVLPVPAHRVQRTEDGLTLRLAGRPLQFLDTPGHARHHHCIWDERSRGFFTGDTFGLAYPQLQPDHGAWAMPTTSPVQFEPEAMRASVQRLLSYEPSGMYLTHFGRVTQVASLGALLLQQMDEMVACALELPDTPERHARMKQTFSDIHLRSLQAQGCTRSVAEVQALLALDIELNAQGMGVWLQRRQGQGAASRG